MPQGKTIRGNKMTNYTDKEKMEIAQTIINQMGAGGRLRAMIGAKDILALDAGVQFKFMLSKGGNKVVIELTPDDLYNMTFYKVGRLNKKTWDIPVKEVAKFEGVYNDQLKPIFEETTGLYLSL